MLMTSVKYYMSLPRAKLVENEILITNPTSAKAVQPLEQFVRQRVTIVQELTNQTRNNFITIQLF